MWQQHKSVLDVARLNLWPAGNHKLGVKWANGVKWNKEEIDRHIAAGEYSAAQCLSRLTDGMPNHTGPPNGPHDRKTLATKWLERVHKPLCLTQEEHAEEIKQHVAQLREHVALQVALQLGLCDEHGRATMMAATGQDGKKRVARTATYGAPGSVTASRAAPAEAADAAECRRQILAEAAERRAPLQQACSSSVSGAAAQKRPAPASPPIAELAAAPAAMPAAAPRKKPRPEDVIDLDSD